MVTDLLGLLVPLVALAAWVLRMAIHVARRATPRHPEIVPGLLCFRERRALRSIARHYTRPTDGSSS